MGFTLNQLEQERQIRKLQKKEDKDTKDYEQLSNLPKVNNVELKGDKTTSDLEINATNVMMSDGVTSVEDELGSKSTMLVKDVTITLTPGYLGGTISVSTGISPNKILSLYLIYSDDVFHLIKTDEMVGFIYSITENGDIIMISPPGKTMGSIAAQRNLNFRVAYLI